MPVPTEYELNKSQLTVKYDALQHSVSGSALLNGVLAADTASSGALYQSAWRTTVPDSTIIPPP